ncbi:MAG: FAD-dependent oxidoreductase [Actinomycetota bacterium]|nr:FAD-dependent oxidoreductase [Actinomycetota bacterium]
MSRARRSASGVDRYDLVVVGGGTGGLVSALVAAGIGARVALVERARMGGDCLWTGCVPSKSLLAAADLAHRIRHADQVGLVAGEPVIDFAQVMAHVDQARRAIAPQDSVERLEREGVDVVSGHARFERPGLISAQGRQLSYRKAIIATGSRPALPPIPGLAQAQPLTSETVWDAKDRPASLVVLGGGAIGCELAQGFARLGSHVTLIEAGDRLLAREEPRASELIASRLRAEGIDVRLGAQARVVRSDGTGGELDVEHSRAPGRIPFQRLLVAAGRDPSTTDLGLDRVGVRTDRRGSVWVDGRLRTAAAHIFAVGDVTGAMPFTHVAAYHARVATVNALFGARRRVDYATVPRVTFTDPEVAAVGLTEADARARWNDAEIVSFDYAELDRAVAEGRRYGFVTLIGDPRGRLVGATIAAPGGAESIAELTAWIATGAKLDRISQVVHAYPTLSEGPARAADAHLRARFAAPRMQRLAGVALQILGRVDRPR